MDTKGVYHLFWTAFHIRFLTEEFEFKTIVVIFV